MHSPTVALAINLIQRPSITPNDEGCQELMATYLENLGFEITRLKYGDVNNFFALKQGTVGAKTLMFAGHTDVVPVGDEARWHTPAFEPQIIDGMLYGRGSADMKGSLAAMLEATREFVNAHPKHEQNIAYLITADEEGPAINGTVKVCEYLLEHNIPIDYTIVGEPSSTRELGDVIKNGRRGSLNGFVEIIGTQGHIAYPHLANNPIHLIGAFLTELTSISWDEGTEFFDATSLQFSNINSGTGATNIIPASVHMMFNFRYNTLHTHTQLQQRVESLLRAHKLEYTIRWHHSGKPFITGRGGLVDAAVDAIREELGVTTTLSTGGGTSDGRFIAPMLGSELIELGPINKTIHQINECVCVDDLDRLAKVYGAILTKLI